MSPERNSMPPARKRILLVDDSTTILQIETYILRGLYDLLTADDGDEAVRKAIEYQPHLILLDVIMPRMSGFEASRLIRSTDVTKSIPIILITNRREAENVQQSATNHCDDYIIKPINKIELLSKVHRFLGTVQEVQP
jgi:CheY-like chemotaxis protein